MYTKSYRILCVINCGPWENVSISWFTHYWFLILSPNLWPDLLVHCELWPIHPPKLAKVHHDSVRSTFCVVDLFSLFHDVEWMLKPIRFFLLFSFVTASNILSFLRVAVVPIHLVSVFEYLYKNALSILIKQMIFVRYYFAQVLM